MYHLGYYNSKVSYTADTIGRKVKVHYKLETGNPTRIDTFGYRLVNDQLQKIANQSIQNSLLVKGDPVTKAAVIAEIGRMVDTFRNYGYYKLSSSELRLRGDTTIAALTTITDDPFEQMLLLAEAQQKRDSPEIKLAMVLNKPEDSTRLNQYSIRHIYLCMDYFPGDNINDTTGITQRPTRNFILRYHQALFRTGFLSRNITLWPGQLYRQQDYDNTITNLAKTNQWQSINLQVREVKDSSLVDLILELMPEKKFASEASVEASYAAATSNSNILSGNLIGLSLNFSLANRNIGKEGIKMTHHLRAGIELNNRFTNGSFINSNEVSYDINISIPRMFSLFGKKRTNTLTGRQRAIYKPGESFINSSIALTNRLGLFNMQSFTLNFGKSSTYQKGMLKNWKWIWKPINLEFNYLYNISYYFDSIIKANPFLRYSYNTSFIAGTSFGLSHVYNNPKNVFSRSRERAIKINFEESGLTWGGLLPLAKKYKSKYARLDAEYKYSIQFAKTSLVLRGFAGIGVPFGKDTSLPFFKQFYGGGTNSMRGWPIRGIGAGGQLQAPYSNTLFNDRRGDMQIELNAEYRYNIARIIPNLLTLKGALFADVGNVWNVKNSKADGSTDTTQFKFANLYKQLGVSVGTGLRLDFNYVVLRLDFGFRLKRPETSDTNNGWKIPEINGPYDLFKKIFTRGASDEYKKWRYENFNFTLGIGFPF